MSTPKSTNRAGWTLRDWCAETSISRPYYYMLPSGLRPTSVTLGRRRIITEAPADWLRRIAERNAKAAA